MTRRPFVEAVKEYLMARPGVWVNAGALQGIGGQFAWRTRVSEARKALEAAGQGTIENQLVPVRDLEGVRVRTDSFYRYVPATTEMKAPTDAHNLNDWTLR
jgi:hypothetical protein